jgi:sugar diacid utilization regulator
MSLGPGAVEPWGDSDAAVRNQLSSLQALLVLSMLMTERSSEQEIVQLASTSVGSLGRAVFVGVFLLGGGWVAGGEPLSVDARDDIERQVEATGEDGLDVALEGPGWRYAFALRTLHGQLGYFVVAATDEPSAREQFLLRVLSQQTGVALANAHAHARQRETAAELAAANAQLERTVAELELSIAIHARLTEVAASAVGQQGIADAVHELTGRSVAVEDHHGNLRAWAGPGRPHPYPKPTTLQRDALIRRMQWSAGPLRDGDRILAIASPGDGTLGVLVLMDPDGTAGELETVALEHGATVLAMELARLRSVAETELRLGRQLVDELLTGIDDERALARSQGLGYDLERPHRVVLVNCAGESTAEGSVYHAVRRAARDAGVGSLVGTQNGNAVLLADRDQPWEDFRARVSRELAGADCVVGVGGVCTRPSEYPASHHEAQLALRMQVVAAGDQKAVEFSGLGVYRLLAEIEHPSDVETFVREWLGRLIDYDAHRDSSELVPTLSRYLECGGNYDATAKALSLHRNTLKYRLQRIREITGRDLNDADDRFNLQLATRAWQTLQALRTQ